MRRHYFQQYNEFYDNIKEEYREGQEREARYRKEEVEKVKKQRLEEML